MPVLPASSNQNNLVIDDKYESEIETHRLEAHFDLAAAALITGLSNTITLRADDLNVRYQGFDHDRMKQISLHENLA